MLQNASLAVRLPASDLERARAWYRDKLGLEPVEERPGGHLYRVGGTEFAVFASQGRSRAEFTQMGFYVEDVDAVVAALRERGVVFEPDEPIDIDGNYPSKGSGERATWFRDSENNLLGLGQIVP